MAARNIVHVPNLPPQRSRVRDAVWWGCIREWLREGVRDGLFSSAGVYLENEMPFAGREPGYDTAARVLVVDVGAFVRTTLMKEEVPHTIKQWRVLAFEGIRALVRRYVNLKAVFLVCDHSEFVPAAPTHYGVFLDEEAIAAIATVCCDVGAFLDGWSPIQPSLDVVEASSMSMKHHRFAGENWMTTSLDDAMKWPNLRIGLGELRTALTNRGEPFVVVATDDALVIRDARLTVSAKRNPHWVLDVIGTDVRVDAPVFYQSVCKSMEEVFVGFLHVLNPQGGEERPSPQRGELRDSWHVWWVTFWAAVEATSVHMKGTRVRSRLTLPAVLTLHFTEWAAQYLAGLDPPSNKTGIPNPQWNSVTTQGIDFVRRSHFNLWRVILKKEMNNVIRGNEVNAWGPADPAELHRILLLLTRNKFRVWDAAGIWEDLPADWDFGTDPLGMASTEAQLQSRLGVARSDDWEEIVRYLLREYCILEEVDEDDNELHPAKYIAPPQEKFQRTPWGHAYAEIVAGEEDPPPYMHLDMYAPAYRRLLMSIRRRAAPLEPPSEAIKTYAPITPALTRAYYFQAEGVEPEPTSVRMNMLFLNATEYDANPRLLDVLEADPEFSNRAGFTVWDGVLAFLKEIDRIGGDIPKKAGIAWWIERYPRLLSGVTKIVSVGGATGRSEIVFLRHLARLKGLPLRTVMIEWRRQGK